MLLTVFAAFVLKRPEPTEWGGYAGYDGWFAAGVNNAALASVAAYAALVPDFGAALERVGGCHQWIIVVPGYLDLCEARWAHQSGLDRRMVEDEEHDDNQNQSGSICAGLQQCMHTMGP